PAIALCDRNGVYGAQRFSVAAREHGVRPIIGAELSMEGGGILPVLVESRAGYKNLCELLTQAHLRSEKGKCEIKWDDFPSFAEGLVVFFNATLLDKLDRLNRSSSQGAVEALVRVFGRENVFVEVQRHFVRGGEEINRRLVNLARARGLPLIATNG